MVKSTRTCGRIQIPDERNANGRTRSRTLPTLYSSSESLEGFFDKHGGPVIENPSLLMCLVLMVMSSNQGSKQYLKNERDSPEADDPLS